MQLIASLRANFFERIVEMSELLLKHKADGDVERHYDVPAEECIKKKRGPKAASVCLCQMP